MTRIRANAVTVICDNVASLSRKCNLVLRHNEYRSARAHLVQGRDHIISPDFPVFRLICDFAKLHTLCIFAAVLACYLYNKLTCMHGLIKCAIVSSFCIRGNMLRKAGIKENYCQKFF